MGFCWVTPSSPELFTCHSKANLGFDYKSQVSVGPGLFIAQKKEIWELWARDYKSDELQELGRQQHSWYPPPFAISQEILAPCAYLISNLGRKGIYLKRSAWEDACFSVRTWPRSVLSHKRCWPNTRKNVCFIIPHISVNLFVLVKTFTAHFNQAKNVVNDCVNIDTGRLSAETELSFITSVWTDRRAVEFLSSQKWYRKI